MKFLSILAVILLSNLIVNAQASIVPQLPSMQIITNQAKNILSWTCQYDGIKSIAIQRSSDSVRNFVTIGVLATPKKGIQTYTDLRPLIGKNSYRLSILFAGDVVWFSNTYKVIMDTEVIAKPIEEVIKLDTTFAVSTPVNAPAVKQPTDFDFTPSVNNDTNPNSGYINTNLEDTLSKKYAVEWFSNTSKVIMDTEVIAKSIEEVIKPNTTIAVSKPVNVPAFSQPTDFYFTPSVRIYTNPNNGHININLEDALSKKYSIRFFDPAKNEILRVSRIIKTTLILDKNNFNAKGTYSFQLFDGSIIHETGYITVY